MGRRHQVGDWRPPGDHSQIPPALRKALIREGYLTEATAPSVDTIVWTGAHHGQVLVMNYLIRNNKKADQRGSDNPFAGGGNGVNGYASKYFVSFP